MNLSNARMMVTFTEDAKPLPPCKTLDESLSYAWTSFYIQGSDAEVCIEWVKNNVICITPFSAIHKDSPAWTSTENDVPHQRVEVHHEWDIDDRDVYTTGRHNESR